MKNGPIRNKRVRIMAAALAVGTSASLIPSLVLGDAQADANLEHMTLQEIVVTDSVIEDSATVVGPKTIEKGKNTTIPDAIKDEPDITISRRAAVGDTKDIVSIRGLSTNRIELDINGRPVNAAGVVGGYYIDWGTIPLDNIEKIEIIRGGSSALYGNNNLGGVINVITKSPTETPTFTLYGNLATADGMDLAQNYRLNHSYKIGVFGYSLGGSYQKAEPFLLNNDFEGKNFTINTEVDMPFAGLLSLGLQYSENNRGFIVNNRRSTDPDNPGFNQKINPDYPLSFGENLAPPFGRSYFSSVGATSEKTKYYLDLGYEQPIGDALVEFKLYKNIEDRDEKNYSLNGLVPGYSAGTLVVDQSVESDRSYGSSLKATVPFGDHEMVGGIQYKVLAYGDITVNYIDVVYNGRPNSSSKPSQESEMIGYFLQDTWAISDSFILTAGLRYDTYELKPINDAQLAELSDETLAPKLTGTYAFTDADRLTASIYQSNRTPGLPEMWWWANGMTRGNPTLKPEKNNAAEMIYQHRFSPTAQTRLSAYYYDIDDYIMMRFDPDWRGVYNIDQVQIYGASIEQQIGLTSWLSARATLTYQESKKEGDTFDTARLTDELDFFPQWKASLGLEFKLPYQASMTTDFHYSSDRSGIYAYTNSSGGAAKRLVTVDSSLTCDLNVKVPVLEQGELSLFAQNLFNASYEETYGYPLPGILVGTSFKWNF